MKSATSPIRRLIALLSPTLPKDESGRRAAAYMQDQLISSLAMLGTVNAFAALALALILAPSVPYLMLLAWLVPLIVMSCVQINSGRQLKRRPRPLNSTGRLLRSLELTSLFFGFWWSLPCILFIHDDPSIAFLVFMTVAGICAGATSLLSGVGRMAMYFTAGIIPLTLTGVFLLEDSNALIFSALALALLVASFRGMRNHTKALRRLFESQCEAELRQRLLANAMDAFEGAFAVYSATGERITANARHEEWGFDTNLLNSGKRASPYERLHNGLIASHRIDVTEHGEKVVIRIDVTDLMRTRARSEAAALGFEQTLRAMDDMIAHLLRDLRAPAQDIACLAQVLGTDSRINPHALDGRRIVTEMGDISRRLSHALDDLAYIQRMRVDDRGEISLVNVGAAFASVTRHFSTQPSPLKIETDCPADQVIEGCQEDMLVRLLTEAVEAVRPALEPGGAISLISMEHQGQTLFAISPCGHDRLAADLITALRDAGAAGEPCKMPEHLQLWSRTIAYVGGHIVTSAREDGRGLGFALPSARTRHTRFRKAEEIDRAAA
jgi:hypothetical protein